MSIRRYNSLISKYFSQDLLDKMTKIYRARNEMKIPKSDLEYFRSNRIKVLEDLGDNVLIRVIDNNMKINMVMGYIRHDEYWRDKVVNFGTGTNRIALITDNYVFKIALDRPGGVDNLHEFYMSSELQPDVAKAYETNELICVCEYARVINDEGEFYARKDEIMEILQRLEGQTSLMLDVGFITKNMTNWGIRISDEKPIIIDYGYVYTNLENVDLTCMNQKCIEKHGLTQLEYTSSYSGMYCPHCGNTYGVDVLQSLITEQARRRMYEDRLSETITVNKETSYFEINEYNEIKEVNLEEGFDMTTIESGKKITRGNVEKLQKEFMQAWGLMERDAVCAGGETDPDLYEKAEKARRLYIEAMYDCDFENLEPEVQGYNPYSDLRDTSELEHAFDDRELYAKYALKGDYDNRYEVDSRAEKLCLGDLNPNEEQYKVHESTSVNETPIYLSRREIDDCISEALSVADEKVDCRGNIVGNRFQDLAQQYMVECDDEPAIDMQKEVDRMINGNQGEPEMDEDTLAMLNGVFNTNTPRVSHNQDNRQNRGNRHQEKKFDNKPQEEKKESVPEREGVMDRMLGRLLNKNDKVQITETKTVTIEADPNQIPPITPAETQKILSDKAKLTTEDIKREKLEPDEAIQKNIGEDNREEHKLQLVEKEETIINVTDIQEYEIRVPIQDIDEETDIDRVVMFATGIMVSSEEVSKCAAFDGIVNEVQYKHMTIDGEFINLNMDTDNFAYDIESLEYVSKDMMTAGVDQEALEDMISHIKDDAGVIEGFTDMDIPQENELESLINDAVKNAQSSNDIDTGLEETIEDAMNQFGFDEEYDKNEKFNNKGGNNKNWR